MDEQGPENAAGFDHGFWQEPADEAGHDDTGDAGWVAEIMHESKDEGGHALDDQNISAVIHPDTDKRETE